MFYWEMIGSIFRCLWHCNIMNSQLQKQCYMKIFFLKPINILQQVKSLKKTEIKQFYEEENLILYVKKKQKTKEQNT